MLVRCKLFMITKIHRVLSNKVWSSNQMSVVNNACVQSCEFLDISGKGSGRGRRGEWDGKGGVQ